MLSSAADLTWLLQDITKSYCMNSQEARQKLTVQIKGIVNAKICMKITHPQGIQDELSLFLPLNKFGEV